MNTLQNLEGATDQTSDHHLSSVPAKTIAGYPRSRPKPNIHNSAWHTKNREGAGKIAANPDGPSSVS